MAKVTTDRILIVRVGWLDYYDDRRDETAPLAGGSKSLRVEVKGTTGDADKILLTRNEVDLAKDGGTALFVLSNLRLQSKNGDTRATRGTPTCINPWVPRQDHLEALTYAYHLRRSHPAG